MRILVPFLIALSLLPGSAPAGAQTQSSAHSQTAAQASRQDCERLAGLAVPNANLTTAKTVAAGTFVGPPHPYSGVDMSAFYKQLPAFCRVVVHAKPSADSDIVIEVWMPLAGWNGKLQGIGNGGFAGLIDYTELGAAVTKGYAVTATDTGHTGSPIDATWAVGHPEKVVDFGYRGIHEMTRIAKIAVEQFYADKARHSYFSGCSDGGREALMEAQRYPDDYDGILAGAPANYWTALLTTAVADTQALTATPDSFIPPAKIPVLGSAVATACDQIDGVRDGILNDPRQCRFDPATLECKPGEDADKCFNAAQVSALKKVYAGIQDASGHTIFPGYLPGGEEGDGGWGRWITGPAPVKSLMAFFGTGYFSNMVYAKSDWDYKSLPVESGLGDAKERTAAVLDAVNPDLTAFRSRGGKLILYHGWNDPAITALNTVNYYGEVVAKSGRAKADSFVRLYMVPGMQHCAGGPGADELGQSGRWPASDPQHNVRIALENWVEKGTAPGTIIASKIAGYDLHAQPTMTRPLCPYPQTAQYKGSGDPNSEVNFTCAAPKK